MADSKKVVLLEDDKASARLVSTFLRSKGLEVHECYEGRFAIELALREKPDILIADVLLPDMHGSDAVKQINASRKENKLKVIFLTSLLSKSSAPSKETRLAVGGTEYPALSKPVEPDTLFKIVERLLAGDN